METWSQSLDFEKLGKKFDTPLYIFSSSQLEKNFKEYLNLVGDPQRITVPIKANPSLAPLRYLASWGAGADAASMSEVKTAELAGIPIHKILYNSPAANSKELIFMLRRGASIVVDSIQQLKEIDQEFRTQKFNGKILLRINPSPNSLKGYSREEEWQKLTSHALSDSKFGIIEEKVINLLEETTIPISGLHLHVGTQMDNIETFTSLLKYMHSIAYQINMIGNHQITTIDLGGGLGIPWNANEAYPSIQALVKTIRNQLKPQFEYIIEPGNSLLGNTMGLLTQVKNIKYVRSKRWAIIDVGSDQLISTTLVNWHRQILKPDHEALAMKGQDSIGGPLCFSGDVILPHTQLDGVKTGDYLFIQHCGSYCYSLANNFNGRLIPGMIEVDDAGEGVLVQAKETEAFSTNLFNHNWLNKSHENQEINLDLKKLNFLTSPYLRSQIQEESYEILKAQKENNTYEAQLQISSPVDFISLPLAIRIISDLSIMFALELVGKKVKDISVWGDEIILNAPKQISSKNPVNFKVSFSSVMQHKSNEDNTMLCYFSLNNEDFSGSGRIRFNGLLPNVHQKKPYKGVNTYPTIIQDHNQYQDTEININK